MSNYTCFIYVPRKTASILKYSTAYSNQVDLSILLKRAKWKHFRKCIYWVEVQSYFVTKLYIRLF